MLVCEMAQTTRGVQKCEVKQLITDLSLQSGWDSKHLESEVLNVNDMNSSCLYPSHVKLEVYQVAEFQNIWLIT